MTECWCPYHAVWEEPEQRRFCERAERVRAWCERQMQRNYEASVARRAPLVEMWQDAEAKYSAGIRRPRRWFPRSRYWIGRGLRRLAAAIDS